MNRFSAYFGIEKRLRDAGYEVDRSDLVWDFTGGRTTSLSALSHVEYCAFLDALRTYIASLGLPSRTKKRGASASLSEDKIRKKMLHYGYLMGWDKPRTQAHRQMSGREINLYHVKAWCVSAKSKYKKPLYAMSKSELVGSLNQMEMMYRKELRIKN